MCKEQKRRCSFLLLNHRLYYLSISSGRFLVLPIRQKKAQKVILILRVETHKTKKVSVFFKNFEFTPLQNQNFRYNNHRPVRLCSSVGRAGDWKSPCHWFDSDRRHHLSEEQELLLFLWYAAVAHLVERHLAKVEVASSSLVGRSKWSGNIHSKYGDVAKW